MDNASQIPEEKILTVSIAASYLLFFFACWDMCVI